MWVGRWEELVTVSGVRCVQSQYRGHLKELMEYVDASVDGIVVAGGDGTVLEVLNGLSLRKDAVSLLSDQLFFSSVGG